MVGDKRQKERNEIEQESKRRRNPTAFKWLSEQGERALDIEIKLQFHEDKSAGGADKLHENIALRKLLNVAGHCKIVTTTFTGGLETVKIIIIE